MAENKFLDSNSLSNLPFFNSSDSPTKKGEKKSILDKILEALPSFSSEGTMPVTGSPVSNPVEEYLSSLLPKESNRTPFTIKDPKTGKDITVSGDVLTGTAAWKKRVPLSAYSQLSKMFEDIPTAPELKGTKVVGSSGKPALVFHGTPFGYDEFDPSKLNSNSKYGKGYYFGEDPGLVSRYSNPQFDDLRGLFNNPEANTPNLRPAYLNIQNPFNLDGRNEVTRNIGNIAKGLNLNPAETSGRDIFKKFLDRAKSEGIAGGAAKDTFQNALKQDGYDGMHSITGHIGTEFGPNSRDPKFVSRGWVAFDKDQIVPAFSKMGTPELESPKSIQDLIHQRINEKNTVFYNVSEEGAKKFLRKGEISPSRSNRADTGIRGVSLSRIPGGPFADRPVTFELPNVGIAKPVTGSEVSYGPNKSYPKYYASSFGKMAGSTPSSSFEFENLLEGQGYPLNSQSVKRILTDLYGEEKLNKLATAKGIPVENYSQGPDLYTSAGPGPNSGPINKALLRILEDKKAFDIFKNEGSYSPLPFESSVNIPQKYGSYPSKESTPKIPKSKPPLADKIKEQVSWEPEPLYPYDNYVPPKADYVPVNSTPSYSLSTKLLDDMEHAANIDKFIQDHDLINPNWAHEIPNLEGIHGVTLSKDMEGNNLIIPLPKKSFQLSPEDIKKLTDWYSKNNLEGKWNDTTNTYTTYVGKEPISTFHHDPEVLKGAATKWSGDQTSLIDILDLKPKFIGDVPF